MNSKKRILNAFYDLLQENSFNKISIEMIIQKSDVSKTTFYRYFHDKYELIEVYYRESIENLYENYSNISDGSYLLANFLHENKEYFQSVFKMEGQNSFYNFMLDYSIRYAEKKCKKNKHDEILSFEEKTSLELYCSGGTYILKRWVLNNTPQSPMEISELIYKCAPNHIKEYLRVC